MRSVPIVVAASVLLLGLGVAPARAKKPKPPACPGGRFPVTGPLVPGGAAGDAILIGDTQVSVESGCPAASAKRRTTRRATILTVRWKDGCGSLTGAVRLRVKLDATTCRTLSGRFRNRKAKIDQRLAAEVEVPADAFGNAGDPLPEGAILVSPEEWEQMKQRPDFHSLGAAQRAADEAAEADRAAADEQTVMEFLTGNPSFADQYLGGVAPDDGSVVPTDNGNYDVTFTDDSGASRTVRTHGRRYFLGNVAAALRRFPSSANQLGLYDEYYNGLAAIDPALPQQYPTPEEVRAMPLDAVRALNDNFAIIVDQFLPLVPPPGGLPPPGYPSTCAAEERAGDGSDRFAGTCTAHKPLGVYMNTTWPLKFFATCVKDQAGRGTCWSFATTGAIELTMAKKYSRWINLGEQSLIHSVHGIWDPRYYGDGFWPGEALRLIAERGYVYPFEDQWDYNPSRSRTANDTTKTYTNSCLGYASAERDFCSNTVGQGLVFCVDLLLFRFCATTGPSFAGDSGVVPTAYSEVWSSANPSLSLGSIFWAVGIFRKPVIYSFAVAPSFYPDGNGYVRYNGPHCPVVTGSDGKPVCVPGAGCECDIGGHAVLITGLIDNEDLPPGAPLGSGGGYVIIKNSWGNCYGDSGYAYLPYDWVKAYAMSAVVLGDVN